MSDEPSAAASNRTWIAVTLACALVAVLAAELRGPRDVDAVEADVPRRAGAEPAPFAGDPEGVLVRAAVEAPVADAVGAAPATDAAPATGVRGVVRDRDGRPIAGARCALAPGTAVWGREPAGGEAAASGEAAAEAVTGTDGRFALPADEGFWRLTVEAGGYARFAEDGLRPGERRDVVLVPAARLQLRIRDERGRPVARARVRLSAEFRDVARPALARAVSDEQGVALLEGVGAGRWYVEVRHPEYRYAHREVVLEPSISWRELTLVLARGVRVVGRVTAAGDAGVLEDVRVRVEAFDTGQSRIEEPQVRSAPGGVAYATDASYARGESVRVIASAAGFAEAEVLALVRPPEDVGGEDGEAVLASAERRVRGRAVDSRGEGLAGVAVTVATVPPVAHGAEGMRDALARVTPHAERWRRAATTAEDGSFELARVSADVQTVLMLAADERAPAVHWLAPGPAGEDVDVGEIELVRAASLWGRAVFDDGGPVADADLRAHPEVWVTDPDTWRPTSWWRPSFERTGADGSFRFDQLTPGSYELYLGEILAGSYGISPGASTGPVELVIARERYGEEFADGTVEGSVLDDAGEPFDGAFVALFDERDEPATTGADAS